MNDINHLIKEVNWFNANIQREKSPRWRGFAIRANQNQDILSFVGQEVAMMVMVTEAMAEEISLN